MPIPTVTRTTVEYLYTTVSRTGAGGTYSYTTVPQSPDRYGNYITTTTFYSYTTPRNPFQKAHTRQLAAAVVCLVFAIALLMLVVLSCVRLDKKRVKPPPSATPLVTRPAARNARDDVVPVVRQPSPDAPPPYAP